MRSNDIVIAREPWARVWPEIDVLAREHFAEVDGGVEPRRQYNLNADTMAELDRLGILILIAAWVDGKLAGYCTWNIAPDVESMELWIGQQGAWFVGRAWNHLGLGLPMFREAVKEMKKLGVKCIYPHHRTQGRGDERLGVFFRRLGAKHIQQTYSLWIGE